MTKQLIITGASRGIGLATAELFLQNDWNVINLSRSPCKLENVTNIKVDLSDIAWPDVINDELVGLISGSTQICLVHSAGILNSDNINTVNTENLQKVMQLNVIAATQLNQLILPHMQADSSIIYISSTLGTKSVANTLSYSTSKHAVVGLMRATCQDLAGTMIHTCCICPGFTDTEMMREHIGDKTDIITAIKNKMTHKRFIKPEEIADVVYFSATHAVINGGVIDAHLGQIET